MVDGVKCISKVKEQDTPERTEIGLELFISDFTHFFFISNCFISKAVLGKAKS